MIYQVRYNKLAIMKDGKTGNIPQGFDCAYMDCSIDLIESTLTEHLKKDKYVPVIKKILKIAGHIVN